MKKILYKLKENRIVVDMAIIFCVACVLSLPNFHGNIDIYFDNICYEAMAPIKQFATGKIQKLFQILRMDLVIHGTCFMDHFQNIA